MADSVPARLTLDPTELDRPDWLSDQPIVRAENIAREDISIPRLTIAQKMSPELDDTSSRYIEGLRNGQMFNSLTRENYGYGPLRFSVLRVDPPRWVEFNPLQDGGGVRDANVSGTDPRAQFGPNGEKPIATKFLDFIVLVNPMGGGDITSRIVGLSFKSTGLKAAKDLNGLMNIRSASASFFYGVYAITTKEITNKFGKFYIPTISNAGWVSKDVGNAIEKIYQIWSEKEVVFEREPGSDDEPSFVTDSQM